MFTRSPARADDLPRNGIRDRVFQRSDALPFACRPHSAVAAHLLDAPVNLDAVTVRVLKLDRNLASRAPAAFKRERDLELAQVLAHRENLFQRSDLESHVMQLDVP